MNTKEKIIELLEKGLNPYKVAREIYGQNPTKAQEQHVYQVAKEWRRK
jgi:hypothetical protein